jgi:hypothetical protein
VTRGLADPRQVLQLIDHIDAVGSRPDSAVREHLPEIERQHPHRHDRERGEHGELEPVDAMRRIRSERLHLRASPLKG